MRKNVYWQPFFSSRVKKILRFPDKWASGNWTQFVPDIWVPNIWVQEKRVPRQMALGQMGPKLHTRLLNSYVHSVVDYIFLTKKNEE